MIGRSSKSKHVPCLSGTKKNSECVVIIHVLPAIFHVSSWENIYNVLLYARIFLTYNAESYIVNSICLLYINIYFLLLCVECSGVSNEIRTKW